MTGDNRDNYMSEIVLRHATDADAGEAWRILDAARRRMLAAGKRQWSMEYPSPANVEADISAGTAIVAVDRSGRLSGYWSAPLTGESAYDGIDGRWLTDGEPYLTVHRLAVAPEALRRGVASEMMRRLENYAVDEGLHSIRIDTNYDNEAMLRMLDRLGYSGCGVVRYASGERMAFEKKL